MQIIRKVTHASGPAEVARQLGISIKTLRHYEERGLVAPTRTRSGWRVYEAVDVARLEQILAFKAMGFELSRIASLLDATPDAMAAALAEQELSLKSQIERLNDALEAVRVKRADTVIARLSTSFARVA